MTPDYRAMCAELIDALDSGIPAGRIRMSPLADRARTLLAQPVADGPSAEDLDKSFQQWWYEEGSIGPMPGMDYEEHTKRISRIAWHNGAYFTLQPLPTPEATND